MEDKARGSAKWRAAASRALLGVGVGTWRAVGLALLLLAVTVEKYTVEVGGLTVKPEHVVTLGLLAIMGVSLARGVTRGEVRVSGRWLLRWPLVWIAGYVGMLLAASLINSPDRVDSLRQTAMVGLVAASSWAVWWLVDTPRLAGLGVRMLAGLGLLEAGYTLLVLGAGNFGFTIGTQPGNGGIIVPYGTLWEPNLLGSYLAAAGVLMLSMMPGSRDRRKQGWLAGGLMLVLTALGLSLARAAWVGFFVGAAVVLLLYFVQGRLKSGRKVEWRRGLVVFGLSVVGALAMLWAVAPVVFPMTARGMLVRVNPAWYDPALDPSVQLRVSTTQAALDGIGERPIIGNGAGSYGLTHAGESGGPGWISNLELHILYDSGAIGLALFVGGMGWLVWRALRVVFVSAPVGEDVEDARTYTIGLVGALATLLFAFQATEGTWMALFWVYVGLLARAGVRTEGKGLRTED